MNREEATVMLDVRSLDSPFSRVTVYFMIDAELSVTVSSRLVRMLELAVAAPRRSEALPASAQQWLQRSAALDELWSPNLFAKGHGCLLQ